MGRGRLSRAALLAFSASAAAVAGMACVGRATPMYGAPGVYSPEEDPTTPSLGEPVQDPKAGMGSDAGVDLAFDAATADADTDADGPDAEPDAADTPDTGE